jgi:hypothetical protein
VVVVEDLKIKRLYSCYNKSLKRDQEHPIQVCRLPGRS